MGRGKNLDTLRELDEAILAEIVREGEARINAQFSAATAADQRALTWSGFVITIATATGGGGLTLALSGRFIPLAVIGVLFSGLLSISAFIAIRTVQPKHFCLPGNVPEHWLPLEWESGRPHDIVQARVEQARCLNNQIDDNAQNAWSNARQISLSMTLAGTATILASVYAAGFVLVTVLVRQIH
jgi:hypothetical protein